MSFFAEPFRRMVPAAGQFAVLNKRLKRQTLPRLRWSGPPPACHSGSCSMWTRLDASLPNSLMNRSTICQHRKSHIVAHKRLVIRNPFGTQRCKNTAPMDSKARDGLLKLGTVCELSTLNSKGMKHHIKTPYRVLLNIKNILVKTR